MKAKLMTKISLIMNALGFIGVGIAIIFIPSNSLKIFHLVISILLVSLGGVSTILNIIKTKNKTNLFLSVSTLFIGVIFFLYPGLVLLMFPIFFGLYMLINGLIKLVSYFFYKRIGAKGYFFLLLSCLIDLGFSYIMITNPAENIRTFAAILGIYLILVGFDYFFDFIKEMYPNNFLHKKRRLRVRMPSLIAVFLPYSEYKKASHSLKEYINPVEIDRADKDKKIDIEIFIQVKNSRIGVFGHADFNFEGKIYAYGAYDEDTRTLFNTLGPGVLYEVSDRESYLKFCTHHAKRIVFAFGLVLTDKQKEKVRNKLKEIKNDTTRWKCNQEADKKNDYNDHASRLYKNTKAKFYKFNNSSYKNYFLFSDNCMKLVDDVFGETGVDLLRVTGLLTPGAYYNYLDNEFKRKNSNVITKSIYIKTKS